MIQGHVSGSGKSREQSEDEALQFKGHGVSISSVILRVEEIGGMSSEYNEKTGQSRKTSSYGRPLEREKSLF